MVEPTFRSKERPRLLSDGRFQTAACSATLLLSYYHLQRRTTNGGTYSSLPHLLAEEEEIGRYGGCSPQFSIHAPLTGVFSQNHAMFLLDNEIHRARRYGTPFTLALAAVDQQQGLSPSNDCTFGEELFERVGNLLGKSMREIDIIGRIGLAEFFIILPNVALNDAMIGLERLRLLV